MKKNKTNRVVVGVITDHNDNVLFGIRQDNGKYTTPAGHLEENEDPYHGMLRELKEETGLNGYDVKLVKAGMRKSTNTLIYVFDVKINKEQSIDPSNDPDKECLIWAFLDPNTIVNELHVPLEDNWGLQYWCNYKFNTH